MLAAELIQSHHFPSNVNMVSYEVSFAVLIRILLILGTMSIAVDAFLKRTLLPCLLLLQVVEQLLSIILFRF